MSEIQTFTTTVGDKQFTFETGKLAVQAGGAVTVRVGDTLVLATATMSKQPREHIDFFPLSVDLEERMYAMGKIPGSFFRREARPSTEAILIARLTDRPMRPLFPDGMRNEVQVIVTTLSSDSVHSLDIPSVNAASAATTISDIPWNGPIAAVRVGYIDGAFVAEPTIQEMEQSQVDLRIAGTREAIVMVEASANEFPEDLMAQALQFGHQAMQPLIDLQFEMREKAGKPKREIPYFFNSEELEKAVHEKLGDKVKGAATITDREKRKDVMTLLEEAILNEFVEADPEADVKAIKGIISGQLKKEIRKRVLDEQIRPDGRSFADIREISSEVGLSPRAHGSALFKRGETHCLSIVALGTPREAMKTDGLYPVDSYRFMLHYNFPPYSTGETWFLRGPKRREIGHGMLGQRAIEPMIPSEESFPYTVRVVSEIMSSNGSTSQASICATTLALMDCGVPLLRPVGGIAMGLVTDGEKYAILSDIQGLEDHIGDMDFKVAGTSEGITALQMDMKISGISPEIMSEALAQAHTGRIHILDKMAETLAQPRTELNQWAPRMEAVQIDPKKIGAIIGKGGATIRSLEETYEVSIDIQDDGTIFIAGIDGIKTNEAIEHINTLTQGAEVGKIYSGKVVRIESFGCFVELLPGLDGMVHISQLTTERLNRVEDAVQMGDEIMVMVTAVDPNTEKVRLSRKAVLEGWTLEEAQQNDNPAPRRRDDRGGRGRSGRDDRGGRGRGGRSRDRRR